jgi:dTDP-4-amino-4,6-dideoxygalactose transaminase
MEQRLSRLSAAAELYAQALHGCGLGLPESQVAGARRSWFTYPVLLPEHLDRAAVRAALASAGIASAAYFPPLHRVPGLADQVRVDSDLTHSEDLGQRLLSLPLWSGMGEGEVNRVAEVLRSSLGARG